MAHQGNARPRKHVPQRTCVGCGQVQGKREMVRVVRTPQGQVQVDPTGKRNGRGAYVHQTRSCWEAALGGRLTHALKASLAEPDRQALEAFAASLPIEQIRSDLTDQRDP